MVPALALADLASTCGVGEGGLRPSLRAQLGGREVIVGLDTLLLPDEALTRLEPLIPRLGAALEPTLSRLDEALAEPVAEVALCGQSWYRLRREDWPALLRWLDRSGAWGAPLTLEVVGAARPDALLERAPERGDGIGLAFAALQHAVARDLDRLEISEQRPGLRIEAPWPKIAEEAPGLREPRPAPARRLARGVLALLCGDAREAERELGAARMGREARAERWLAIARNMALHQLRPEPRYQSAPRAQPSMELLASLALERHSGVEPAKKSYRNLVLLVVVLLGAALLWSLSRTFQSSQGRLRQQADQVDLP